MSDNLQSTSSERLDESSSSTRSERVAPIMIMADPFGKSFIEMKPAPPRGQRTSLASEEELAVQYSAVQGYIQPDHMSPSHVRSNASEHLPRPTSTQVSAVPRSGAVPRFRSPQAAVDYAEGLQGEITSLKAELDSLVLKLSKTEEARRLADLHFTEMAGYYDKKSIECEELEKEYLRMKHVGEESVKIERVAISQLKDDIEKKKKEYLTVLSQFQSVQIELKVSQASNASQKLILDETLKRNKQLSVDLKLCKEQQTSMIEDLRLKEQLSIEAARIDAEKAAQETIQKIKLDIESARQIESSKNSTKAEEMKHNLEMTLKAKTDLEVKMKELSNAETEERQAMIAAAVADTIKTWELKLAEELAEAERINQAKTASLISKEIEKQRLEIISESAIEMQSKMTEFENQLRVNFEKEKQDLVLIVKQQTIKESESKLVEAESRFALELNRLKGKNDFKENSEIAALNEKIGKLQNINNRMLQEASNSKDNYEKRIRELRATQADLTKKLKDETNLEQMKALETSNADLLERLALMEKVSQGAQQNTIKTSLGIIAPLSHASIEGHQYKKLVDEMSVSCSKCVFLTGQLKALSLENDSKLDQATNAKKAAVLAVSNELKAAMTSNAAFKKEMMSLKAINKRISEEAAAANTSKTRSLDYVDLLLEKIKELETKLKSNVNEKDEIAQLQLGLTNAEMQLSEMVKKFSEQIAASESQKDELKRLLCITYFQVECFSNRLIKPVSCQNFPGRNAPGCNCSFTFPRIQKLQEEILLLIQERCDVGHQLKDDETVNQFVVVNCNDKVIIPEACNKNEKRKSLSSTETVPINFVYRKNSIPQIGQLQDQRVQQSNASEASIVASEQAKKKKSIFQRILNKVACH